MWSINIFIELMLNTLFSNHSEDMAYFSRFPNFESIDPTFCKKKLSKTFPLRCFLDRNDRKIEFIIVITYIRNRNELVGIYGKINDQYINHKSLTTKLC